MKMYVQAQNHLFTLDVQAINQKEKEVQKELMKTIVANIDKIYFDDECCVCSKTIESCTCKNKYIPENV
jgi:hypothetical protein